MEEREDYGSLEWAARCQAGAETSQMWGDETVLGMGGVEWRKEKIFWRCRKPEIFEIWMSIETERLRICRLRAQIMDVCVCLQLVFIPLSCVSLVLHWTSSIHSTNIPGPLLFQAMVFFVNQIVVLSDLILKIWTECRFKWIKICHYWDYLKR